MSAFYRWSGPLPVAPGKLLRAEPLPVELRLSNGSRQSRILYTSTEGVSGRGIVAVSGVIFLPQGTPPAGGWPVIAWAHGTVGLADVCAPSWAGRSYRDVRYLNKWLAQGYAVVATDYQGLGVPGPHPYLNTRPEAYSVLDAVRAALASDRTLANRVVVVGQSQGGGAAFATAGFAPTYAPDVKLLGAVATGVPDLSPAGVSVIPPADPDSVDPTIAYFFYQFLMAQQTHPSLQADAVFTPEAAPFVDQARKTCIAQLEEDVRVSRLTRRTSVKPQGPRPVLPALFYPTVKLAMPLFVGTGLVDKDVAPETQERLVKAACKAGSVVESRTYPEDHSGTVNASFPDSSAFVAAVFAGRPVSDDCRVQTR